MSKFLQQTSIRSLMGKNNQMKGKVLHQFQMIFTSPLEMRETQFHCIISFYMLLLLLLSHFSHVPHCVILQTATHQALLSLGFSRQEHQSGLPFLSPVHESESEVALQTKFTVTEYSLQCSLVAQSCPTLCDPLDYRLLGSSVHGILQAAILEWVAGSSSRGSFQPRDQTCVSSISCIAGR